MKLQTEQIRNDPAAAAAFKSLDAGRERVKAAREVVHAKHAAFVKIHTAIADPAPAKAQLATLRRQRWLAVAMGAVGDKKADEKIASLDAKVEEIRKNAEEIQEVYAIIKAELDDAQRVLSAATEQLQKLECAALQAILDASCAGFRKTAEAFAAEYDDLFMLELALIKRRNSTAVIPIRRSQAVTLWLPGGRLHVEPSAERLDAAESRVHELLDELGFSGFERIQLAAA